MGSEGCMTLVNIPAIRPRACPERSRSWALSQTILPLLLLTQFEHPQPRFTSVGWRSRSLCLVSDSGGFIGRC